MNNGSYKYRYYGIYYERSRCDELLLNLLLLLEMFQAEIRMNYAIELAFGVRISRRNKFSKIPSLTEILV